MINLGLTILLSLAIFTSSAVINVEYPSNLTLKDFRMKTSQLIPVTVTAAVDDPTTAQPRQALKFDLHFRCAEERICSFPDSPYQLTLDWSSAFKTEFNVNITSDFLGHTVIKNEANIGEQR